MPIPALLVEQVFDELEEDNVDLDMFSVDLQSFLEKLLAKLPASDVLSRGPLSEILSALSED
jgi:hypothetical protein